MTVGLVVGGVLVIYLIMMYNRLVGMRQQIREAWSGIDTELRRRFDLIPNLVETVKGYAAHEHNTLEDVIAARNQAVNAGNSPESQMAAQNVLTASLGKLFALSEAYPQLKANENFQQLQGQLTDTETRLSQARRFYNATVKEFNTACQTFPTAIFSSLLGFRTEPYYGLDDTRAAEPVAVNFSGTSSNSTRLETPNLVEHKEKQP